MKSKQAILDNKRTFLFWLSAVALCVLVMAMPASPQDGRGSIIGRVLDPSGAVIPGAQVTVTNAETNVSTSTSTGPTGDYAALYLNPGNYGVTVTAKGFKKLERRGIELRIDDKLTLDLRLEPGGVTETVEVTGETPLLEAADSSHGTIIDNHRLRELPIQDGNPINLTRLAAGVTPTGSFGPFNRPFDGYGPSSIRVEGAPTQNEYTLNGAPDMSIHATVGFSPPTDTVQESKILNDSYNAQTGHTGAAVIDQAILAGGNRFHGTAYDFNRNTIFNANDFFRNQAHLPISPVHYNRFGGSFSGPLEIPHIYHGRNKTFFLVGVELFRYAVPDNFGNNFTMPTCAQRGFANTASPSVCGAPLGYYDLQALAPLYDPFTGSPSGSQVKRLQLCRYGGGTTCIPGTTNQIDSSRISPVALAYLKFMPLPNLSGLASNFVPSPVDTGPFNSEVLRVDHTVSDKQKIFAYVIRNHWNQTRGGWTAPVNGVRPDGQSFFRNNTGAQIGDTSTFSSNPLLDVRVGFSRFFEESLPTSLGKFDPATMGFSAATLAQFGGYKYVPTLNIESYLGANSASLSGSYFGGSLGKSDGGPSTYNVISLQPTLTWIKGDHALQFGVDLRNYRINSSGPGDVIGHYQFVGNFATANSGVDATKIFGAGYAQFLLGVLSSNSSIDRNVSSSYQQNYGALFVQDNFKVTPKLTLTLGLRYDLELPFTERFDRNVRGFDFTSPNPIQAQAVANYAKNPIPQVPVTQFSVHGGLVFADPNHRYLWNRDGGNFAPRVGFAYQFLQKTVLRGGWGLYIAPLFYSSGTDYSDGRNQAGFSQATSVIPTNDNGLTLNPGSSCTFNCWANPFPNGIATPPGSSLGLQTLLGTSMDKVVPVNRKHPFVQHWSLDVQRELPGQWLLDVGYFGTHGSRLITTRNLNAIPRQYLSTSPIRDLVTINLLTGNVPNPFQGVITTPGAGLGSNGTVARQQLLLAYPEFTGLSVEQYNGISDYQSGQATITKRFSRGFTLLGAYTFSKLLEQVSYLNDTDPNLEKRVSGNNLPHQIVVSGIWEIPIGRGHALGGGWPGALQQIVGGWQLGEVFRKQSGFPIGIGNIYFNGDLRALKTHISSSTVTTSVFDRSPFYIGDVVNPGDPNIQLQYNIRTLPSQVAWFRGQGLNNWDVSLAKKFTIREEMKLAFRAEAFNLFNHTLFQNPNMTPSSSNFGKVAGVSNAPRYLQLGLKLTF